MSDIGLKIREDKCEAFSRVRNVMWPFHRIPFVTDGISILGSPIGSEEYVSRKSLVTFGKERNFLHKLRLLQNIQSASLLLRYCGMGNVTHLLRTVPSQLIPQEAKNHDVKIVECFQSILGCGLTQSQTRQIHLRISQWGFGLPSALLVSLCAFVCSWAEALRMLPSRLQLMPNSPEVLVGTSDGIFNGHIVDALRSLSWTSPSMASEFPSIESLPEKYFKLQKKLSTTCQEAELEDLLENLDQASQARLRSAGGIGSGAWLDALPQSRELSFTNAEFQTAALLRLGAAIPLLRQITKCNCGARVEADGYHLITCPKDGGPIRRHDDWQYFENGKKLLLDISVIHPLSHTAIGPSAKSNGAAAKARDEQKIGKYGEVATAFGYLFKPVVVEVYGRWSSIASVLFHLIARRPSVDFINNRVSFVNHWRKRLSACLQKGNARIILRKLENIIPLNETPTLPYPYSSDSSYLSL